MDMEGGKKHHYSNLLFSHGLRFSLLFYNLESFTAAVSILTPTFACLPKTFCQQLRLQAEVLMADNPGWRKSVNLIQQKNPQNCTWSISSFGTRERKSATSLFGFESGAINFFVNLLMPQPITINLAIWFNRQIHRGAFGAALKVAHSWFWRRGKWWHNHY